MITTPETVINDTAHSWLVYKMIKKEGISSIFYDTHYRMCLWIQDFFILLLNLFVKIEWFYEQIVPLPHFDTHIHRYNCYICFKLIIFSIDVQLYIHTRTHTHYIPLKTNVSTLLNRNDFMLNTFFYPRYWIIYTVVFTSTSVKWTPFFFC